jgi:hypothetical protein
VDALGGRASTLLAARQCNAQLRRVVSSMVRTLRAEDDCAELGECEWAAFPNADGLQVRRRPAPPPRCSGVCSCRPPRKAPTPP